MTNDELIETLMARAGRLEAALEKRVCEICDIHSPREGASN